MKSPFNTAGYFGKLPIRGDFIQRNLSSDFISMWDHWLQLVISSSQKTLGDQWLNTYLVSPIWRFFLVLEEDQYAGIVLPSVDKVGRYFPFTVAVRIEKKHNVSNFMAEQDNWYQQAENIAIQALEENINFDQLNQAIDNLHINDTQDISSVFQHKSKAYHIELKNYSLDMAVAQLQSSAGLMNNSREITYWWHTSLPQNTGHMLCYLGMPDDNIYVAMLDGQWQMSHANHVDRQQH